MSDALAQKNLDLTPDEIVHNLGHEAKTASAFLRTVSTDKINKVLTDLASNIRSKQNEVLKANNTDVINAKDRGLSDALIDRLVLNADRLEAIAQGVENVAKLDDPTGRILWEQDRPNGLKIQRVVCPIGVLGMIYESRPNVTVDASILCLKSHNAVILRGGAESLYSSLALHQIIQETLESHDFPKACVSMIPISDRAAVGAMLRDSEHIDVMIPRGGKGLIERVMNEARMPVFGHLEGLCHIFIDQDANLDKALSVTLNAKMRRTGICGAMETLLLDSRISDEFAQSILSNIIDSGCEVVGDDKVQQLDDRISAATAEDWATEYLCAKLSVRYVDDIHGAVDHINSIGSHHTDCIITENQDAAEYFFNNIDSGIVMHNASTQFADGGEFGMGAEIGIATGKMHARGPVGLDQLCTYKYLVRGQGQTRP